MNSENGGPIALMVNIYSTVFIWLTAHDIQPFFSLVATIASIVSCIFAARYYYKKAKS